MTRSNDPERREQHDRRPVPHHHRKESPGGVPQWVLITVILVVTSAWVTNFLVSVFNNDYHPPGTVNTAFITIVGTILVNAAARYRGSNSNKNDNNTDEERPTPPRPRPRLDDEDDNYRDGERAR